MLFPSLAAADATSEFMKSLAGKYSGKGVAIITGSKSEKVACRIENSFDEGENRLSLEGKCASTKGKGDVSGSIAAEGKNISGTFLAPNKNMKVTQSSGRIQGDELVLFTSLYDDKAGQLTRIQQVIEKTSSGIAASFFTYDNATKKYEKSGSIKLKSAE